MKQWLLLAHRWLGMGLALLFLLWFLSGMVLVFVDYPRFNARERLDHMPPIDAGRCCVPLDMALSAAGLEQVREVRLAMHQNRPVYRILPGGSEARWVALFADTGERMPPLNLATAASTVSLASGRPANAIGMFEYDQWTVAGKYDSFRPLIEVALKEEGNSSLYISRDSGEIVLDTHRVERFWNWLGAVPHWIYPKQLRTHPDLWHHVMVWLSMPGVILAITGIYVGLIRLRRGTSPYRERWLRWHHVAGLGCALFITTWILSGLLSMNPFGLYPPRVPDHRELAAWQGGTLEATPAMLRSVDFRRALSAVPQAREAIWTRVGDHDYIVVQKVGQFTRLIDAASHTSRSHLAPREAEVALMKMRPDHSIVALELINAHDDYYYPRRDDPADRRLPALRAEYADGTWIYVDLAAAKPVLRLTASNRVQRWLYNGLHSLDFAWLRERPALRKSLLLLLCAMGATFSLTGVVLGLRLLIRASPLVAAIGLRRRSPGDAT